MMPHTSGSLKSHGWGDGVFRTDNCHNKNIIPAPMTMQNYRNNNSVKNVLSVEKIFTTKMQKI